MAFDGKEGEQISKPIAGTMTAAYRNANPNGTLGHFMGKELLMAILTQSGCMGIRVYHALDENNNPQLVFVGVDANENDLESGIIADRTLCCPSRCSVPNTLNGL